MAQAYAARKRTILCIDDDHAILAYERSLLERSGYYVLTTPSPRQGLKLVTICQIDAVVLDYHMPEMSGHEVAVSIKKCQPKTLIVMFSASDIPEETCKIADAVVLKTDAIERLLPTVAQVCDRASLS